VRAGGFCVRILAVGTRFFPYPHAGDKTFWFAALQTLASQGNAVRVLSIDVRGFPLQTVGPGLEWETMPAIPFFLRTGPHRDRYNPAQREIGAITNYVSKSLTMPQLFRKIGRIVAEWKPDTIHFMDNLGPATFPFLRRLGRPVFVSAVTYDPRNSVYDQALRWSLQGFERVAASSDAFGARLRAIGLPAEKVHTVHWGVAPVSALSEGERANRKRELGVDPDRPLVLWSGFLQQTTVEDFWTAFEASEQAERLGGRFDALFCFKPQHHRPEYTRRSSERLRVSLDPGTFLKARECADLFLNPVGRGGSILAPPLTWVEVLMRGIPILTTPCGGLDEALGSGAAGQVGAPKELGGMLAALVADPGKLAGYQQRAREWASAQYSLAGAVRGLFGLWEERG
jgi:glycosyltransferase involved in cell wall biosynthesis